MIFCAKTFTCISFSVEVKRGFSGFYILNLNFSIFLSSIEKKLLPPCKVTLQENIALSDIPFLFLHCLSFSSRLICFSCFLLLCSGPMSVVFPRAVSLIATRSFRRFKMSLTLVFYRGYGRVRWRNQVLYRQRPQAK